MSLTVPSVRKPLITGLGINALIFTVVFALPFWGIIAFVHWLRTWTPDTGLSVLDWLLDLLLGSSLPFVEGALVAGFVFLAPVVFNILTSIVMPIFKTRVWNAARGWAGGPEVDGKPSGVVVEARLIGVELRRLGRFLVFSALLLPLNLLPWIGTVAYLGAQFLLTAHTLGWDLLAYHFELHDIRYADQKPYLRRHRKLALGLGSVAALLLMVPVAQVLFVGTNAAGAGLLSAEMDGARAAAPAR